MKPKQRLWIILLLLAAFGFRVYRLDQVPPGLQVDDERWNLEIIDQVQQGDWRLFYAGGWGREGGYYYVAALWAGVGEERPPGFRTVHNVPLLAAAELGIGGAILWLWMLLASPVATVCQLRRSVPAEEYVNHIWERAGWAAASVSAFVVSLFDNYLYIPTTWWPALYLALVTGEWARAQLAAAHRTQQQ